MKFIRGLHHWPQDAKPQAITIGNFDGVHLGHQHILKTLHQYAQQHQLESLLIIMEPQPQEFFAAPQAKVRLTRLREKWHYLQQSPVDNLLCLPFNAQLANMSATDFIIQLLCQSLNMAYILVGDDFRFGQRRQGDVSLLEDYAAKYGFKVARTPTIHQRGERVSSTRIREALATGKLEQAHALLGRAYRLCGRVVRGQQLGRQWGVPTANIPLKRSTAPLTGVFIVNIYGVNSTVLHGVANVGTRPSIDGKQPLLEVHIFDFAEDIYGKMIGVEFIKKLRDEQRFANIEDLKQRIWQDVRIAKAFFETETI